MNIENFLKKLTITLIFILMETMACQNLTYALRVPIIQEYDRIKKLIIPYGEFNISIVDPEEYDTYADIFLNMLTEETGRYGQLAKENKAKNFRMDTMRGFYVIIKMLDEQSPDILALFALRDPDGNTIGARLLYKPEHIDELDLTAVRGLDVIRQEYQHNGIGTVMRKLVLEWIMKETKCDKYVAAIHPSNEASIRSFEKACDDLGLSFKPTGVFIDGDTGEAEQYQFYLVDLALQKTPLAMSDVTQQSKHPSSFSL